MGLQNNWTQLKLQQLSDKGVIILRWALQDSCSSLYYFLPFVAVQSPSHAWLFETPWTATLQASLSLTLSQSFTKFIFIALVMPSSYLILWHSLLLPSVFPSIRDFSSESAVCIRWPKYWSFIFSISPSEYSGFISLKIDWFDLLAVQGTLRSLLQHCTSKGKASILWRSAFFMVQFSQPYVTGGIALTLWTFVSSVTSLFFNTLSVCHSFPAKKQSSSDFMAAVTIRSDFKTQEEEICHYFCLFPFYLPWSNGPDAMILGF